MQLNKKTPKQNKTPTNIKPNQTSTNNKKAPQPYNMISVCET